MSWIAIVLLVTSAVVHAGWNVISKHQHPSQTFFLLAGGVGSLLLLPAVIVHRNAVVQIPLRVWMLLAASGFFMALYYVALAGSYRRGDLSIVYPLARSASILFVTFVSFVMGRGHEIGSWALLGMVLVAVGCVLLPMRRFRDFAPRNYFNPCCMLALLAAVGTAGYTVIDDQALAILRGQPDPLFTPMSAAFVYLFLEAVSALFWQSIGLLTTPAERRDFMQAAAEQIKPAALAGIGIYSAYGLALASMAFVNNVSYVAAFRQLSIPIGAGVGIMVLKEPGHGPRVVGVTIMIVGLVLVAID